MATGVTLSTDLTNSAVTNYQREYFRLAALPEYMPIHSQFVNWKMTIPDKAGFGGTFDWPVYGKLDPTTAALTEGADVTPIKFDDYNITLSPAEYGQVTSYTNLAQFKSRVDIQKQVAELVTMARVQSQDMIVRKQIYGHGSDLPTQTIQKDGTAAMSGLDGPTDSISWAFLMELGMQARQRGIRPLDGSRFATILPPLLTYDLKNLTEFKTVGYYQDKANIYQGEIGELAGFRIIESPQAKVFWGAGTALQTATTLSAAANAGDTTVTVANAAGIAGGDYVTIGTVETSSVSPSANLEQVYVVSVNSTTLTIQGAGDGTNLGLRYNHAANESVVEAYNVCGIPVIGKDSLIGCHSQGTGRFGVPKFKEGLDLLDRIFYAGWYWYGGVERVERNFLLGKVAATKWTIGCD